MARHAYGGKTTVESCRLIDVLHWNRLGYMRLPRWFSWAWTRDGEQMASINVRTRHHSVALKYRIYSTCGDFRDVEQRVAIQWTPCRFGGARPWFVCSVSSNGVYCGRRVTKLYLAGRLFACRRCYRLAYGSQQEPVHEHGLWKAQKIRLCLGGSANMFKEFPDKPKGMHWRTYNRLRRNHDLAISSSILRLKQYADRLTQKLSRSA